MKCSMCMAAALAVCAASAKDMRIAEDRVVVGNMYAPFCRTEGPDVSEWPSDIAKMRELGYSCLHGFCEWSRIEKAKDVYDFSQIDRLLDLCERNGILAILNVATQNTVGFHMPAWMENEYSGRGSVDTDNNGVSLKSIHNVPCLDDPWYREYAEKFLRELASRYKGDRRLPVSGRGAFVLGRLQKARGRAGDEVSSAGASRDRA